MIYRDDNGHNFTRTKYLNKMPINKVSDDTKSGMLDAPQLSKNPPKGCFRRGYKKYISFLVSSVLNPFSTHRISSSVLAQWPTELGFNLVNRIQSGCSDLLLTFGYKTVTDELSYQNKTISYLPDFT